MVFLFAAGAIVARNRTMDNRARMTFIASFAAIAVICIADLVCTLVNGIVPPLRLMHAVLMATMFSLAPTIPAAISNTIFPEKFFKWLLVVFAAHALLQFASIFGGFIFFIDDQNVYHRGPFYAVYMLVYSASSLYLVVESLRASAIYQSVSVLSLVGILACLATGVAIQVADGSVRTTWPAAAMAVVLYSEFYSEMVLRTDALTKLLNRHSYGEFMGNPSLPCVVVAVDVDDFKQVNDTYGHAFGDECLEKTAAAIKETFGKCGLCYRTGGDEFLVAMTKHLDESDNLVQTLLDTIGHARAHDDRLPTVSVGCAVADAGCRDIDAVVREADKAMYQSKADGKIDAGTSHRHMNRAPASQQDAMRS